MEIAWSLCPRGLFLGFYYETATLGTCRNTGVQLRRIFTWHLILKLVWHYLLLSLQPSLCILLLPDHHFPQTVLFIPADPPLLDVTCRTRRAGGRQRLSRCCCWRAQQGRAKPWVLPTRSFNQGPRIPLVVANMPRSLLPHIKTILCDPWSFQANCLLHKVEWMRMGLAQPCLGPLTRACFGTYKERLSSSVLQSMTKICLSSAGEAAMGVWRQMRAGSSF